MQKFEQRIYTQHDILGWIEGPEQRQVSGSFSFLQARGFKVSMMQDGLPGEYDMMPAWSGIERIETAIDAQAVELFQNKLLDLSAKKTMDADSVKLTFSMYRAISALGVMMLDNKIRLYLEKNDPKALEQARDALREVLK